MYKIGEFSRLSRVTVKTLRHYDELGLLKPAQVDRFTSYRYYTAAQLPQLYRILALKDLGLSLEQVGRLLRQGVPATELRGMLRLKQAELQEVVDAEQGRLARVTARLAQLEQEATMSTIDVVIQEVPTLRVVSRRGIVANYGSQGPLWDEAAAYMQTHHLQPNGPCLTVYYDEEYKEQDVDLEVCEPVDAPPDDRGPVKVLDLPTVPLMASTVLHGPYSALNETYSALMQWIAQSGYRIVGPNREVYLRNQADHGVSPEDCVTEVQFPVARA